MGQKYSISISWSAPLSARSLMTAFTNLFASVDESMFLLLGNSMYRRPYFAILGASVAVAVTPEVPPAGQYLSSVALRTPAMLNDSARTSVYSLAAIESTGVTLPRFGSYSVRDVTAGVPPSPVAR